jgi:hypothetical protein
MFLLFAGHSYYPRGGWNDFIGSFASVEDAKTHMLNSEERYDWWHVVSNETITEERTRCNGY